MINHWFTEQFLLYHGNALDVLRARKQQVDSIVTDPPYALRDFPPELIVTTLKAWLDGNREFVPDGKGFMGKDWDKFVPPPAIWDECFRLLKPGGHMLVFAAPRTVDLMTLSIRLAGFEIRDNIEWVYGSGFPKSHNVSKAIDKEAPRAGLFDSFAAHFAARRKESGLTLKSISERFPSKTGGLTGCAWNWENGANVPTMEQWNILAPMLELSDEWLPLIERIEAEREVIGSRKASPGVAFTSIGPSELDVTVPATDDAKRWEGWGTALKPAQEPIIVARKPLEGTVAGNVVKYGTGGINVDACRVAFSNNQDKNHVQSAVWYANQNETFGKFHDDGEILSGKDSTPDTGRWPTNLILTHSADCADSCAPDCPVAGVDAQSGVSTSTNSPRHNTSAAHNKTTSMGKSTADWTTTGFTDSGGSSRFFPVLNWSPVDDMPFKYQAKAPKSERPIVEGLKSHATVKPLALMRWLVRLVTPPDGIVLDPFMGTGTTVQAANLEGFKAIGIDNDMESIQRTAKRLDLDLTTGAVTRGQTSRL